MVNMKVMTAKPVHTEFNLAMKDVLKKFEDRLNAMEMLAIASHFVGVLIALQDKEKVTEEIALDIVISNIEQGNAEAINTVSSTNNQPQK